MSLTLLSALLLASTPEVALLCTPGDGEESELRFQRPGQPLSPAVARFRHVARSTVLGALLPGTRTVLAVAQTLEARDVSWAASLTRLEPGQPPVQLVDRVAIATRPHVTGLGRVFVQRGRSGGPLTIDEVNPHTGATRTVHAFDGWLAFMVGTSGGELLLYRVGPGGAELAAVSLDGPGHRVLTPLAPLARDFVIGDEAVYFTTADRAAPPPRDATRAAGPPPRGERAPTPGVEPPGGAPPWRIERVNLETGAASTVVRVPHVAALPTWLGGRLAFSWGPGEGLRHVDGTLALLPHGPGFERVVTVRQGLAFALHEVPTGFPSAYAVELKTGRALELAAPQGVRLDLAGVVE